MIGRTKKAPAAGKSPKPEATVSDGKRTAPLGSPEGNRIVGDAVEKLIDDYASKEPLDDAALWTEIKKLNAKVSLAEAEFEGLDGQAKIAKKRVETIQAELRRYITAANEGRKVYLLSNGMLTTSAPSKQGSLLK